MTVVSTFTYSVECDVMCDGLVVTNNKCDIFTYYYGK